MAWDWVPVAGVAVAAAAVVVSTAATVAVTRMGHRHTERMSAQRNDHELLLAREARIQQRLEDAYVEVLTFVYRVGQWVDLTRPLIDVGVKAPGLPELDEQARVRAMVSAYASEVVKDLMAEWDRVVVMVQVADMTIAQAETNTRSETWQDVATKQWEKLSTECRPALQDVRARLERQIALELRLPDDNAVGAVDPRPRRRRAFSMAFPRSGDG